MRARQVPLAIFLVALEAASAHAAVPAITTVQGTLETAGGAPVNWTLPFELSLYASETGGEALYSQNSPSVEVVAGVFDVALGPLPVDVLESASSLWLEAVVDGAVLPRRPLRPAPLAVVAQTAGSAGAIECTGCVKDSHVAFPYAASASKGGDASGLDCIECVGSADIAPAAVGTAHRNDRVLRGARVARARGVPRGTAYP